MAIVKKSDIKKMNDTQLKERLIELKKELIKINAQLAIGTMPENPGRVKEVKRTIATINTLMNPKNKREEIKKK
jgi:large subunit ribosomal protein L29